jgi:cobalamin synthase
VGIVRDLAREMEIAVIVPVKVIAEWTLQQCVRWSEIARAVMKAPDEQETQTRIEAAVTTAPVAIAVVECVVVAVVVSLAAAVVSAAAAVVDNFFGSASGARQNPLRAWTVVVRGQGELRAPADATVRAF